MCLKDVLDWIFRSEELVDADGTTVLASKEMTTMCKDYLTTLLDWDFLIFEQCFFRRLVILEDIHHPDSISKTNDDLESGWMERNTECFVTVLFINLEIKAVTGTITPNLDCFVH